MRRMAGVLILAIALVGCQNDEDDGRLLPAPKGSFIVLQGLGAPRGRVEVRLKWVARGKAALSIFVREPEQVGPEDAMLSKGESAVVGGATVTVVAIDDKSERRAVRVLVDEPADPPGPPVEQPEPPSPPAPPP